MKTVGPWGGGVDRKMRCGEDFEQSRAPLPQNLIRLLSVHISKANGSGDLLSRSPVHAGARDGEGYGNRAAARRQKNPNSFWCVSRGGRWIYIRGSETNLVSRSLPKPIRLGLGFRVSYLADLEPKSPKIILQKEKILAHFDVFLVEADGSYI
jgi:hypothetical protein